MSHKGRAMQLGVIADDFTGATDVAGFLTAAGVKTVQLVGVPSDDVSFEADATVVSLKSRSCPPDEAVGDSLAALAWLQARGCRQFYQKYCSTFDSTPQGNIGPVADALLASLGAEHAIVCPALPVNGRTVYNGYLFVNGVLLEQSGMRHHPVNPMTESHLGRLMEAQSSGRAGVVGFDAVEDGAAAVSRRLEALRSQGVRYGVADALLSRHLDVLAEAVDGMPLVTGGSGLAAAMARTWSDRMSPEAAAADGRPSGGPGVVLSGSCSEMTRAQVARYASAAPTRFIDLERTLNDPSYAHELAEWVRQRQAGPLAPLVYATTDPAGLRAARERYGAGAGRAIEQVFASLAGHLAESGTRRFVVAGGETAGAVVQALGVRGFNVGPQIAPGVPWVRAIGESYSMALKSGNFGREDFFLACQEENA